MGIIKIINLEYRPHIISYQYSVYTNVCKYKTSFNIVGIKLCKIKSFLQNYAK